MDKQSFLRMPTTGEAIILGVMLAAAIGALLLGQATW